MPYTMKNPPSTVKNLPSGAKKIFIDTFNAVLADTKDETKARMAAWSNVKKKYKKSGDKWVKKTTAGEYIDVPADELEGIDILAEIKEMQESEEVSITAAFRIQETSSIIKFIEEEGKSKAIYRVIQPGWSGNDFYYGKDVTPQLVPFIEKKPMFFADHLEPFQKKNMIFGQKLTDAVAIAEKVWATDDGQVLAKLTSVENPKTEWIWEAAKKHPEHIGNSIDAYGKVKKGEAEGRKGNIVENFVGYDSTDFVYRPSAGGKFMSVTEAHQVGNDLNLQTGDPVDLSTTSIDWTPPFTSDNYNSLKEATKTLRDLIKRYQKRSLFWSIGNILIDFIYAVSVDYNMSEDDKKKSVDTAVKEFIGQLREIDPVTLFNESLIDGKDIKPIDKLKNKLEDSMDNKELIEALNSYTPAQLLESNPDLYNKIIAASVDDKEVEEALKKVPTLEKDNKELLETTKTLTTTKEKAEKELKEAQDELKKYKDKEEKAEWSGKVDNLIKESEIDNALVTDTFKGQLIESKDEEKVKTLLDDRKGLKTNPDFDNGKPPENPQESKPETKLPSTEELVRAIKAS